MTDQLNTIVLQRLLRPGLMVECLPQYRKDSIVLFVIQAALVGLAGCFVLGLTLIPVQKRGFVVRNLLLHHPRRLPRTGAVVQRACFAVVAYAAVTMERFACLETAFQDEEICLG
ncbi:MAG: hypothetical protein OJF51_000328 [Nitrospira sp.]|nr:MAG: hypothetical protein OJF51_000328 [Nitrospira sp.]